MIYKIVFAFVVVFALVSCKSPSPIQQYQDYKGAKLIVGSGGGFTGQYIDYIILKNGAVYKKDSFKDELVYLGKIKKNHALQLFESFENAGLKDVKCNFPGNMNNYIKFVDNNDEYFLQWSMGQNGFVDPKVKLFYQIAMKKIGELTE